MMLSLGTVAVVMAYSVLATAQVDTYDVGEGGLSWDSQSAVSGGVDLRDPNAVRPIGFAGTDNIISALRWQATPTQDFIAEGDAHIWANAAVEGDYSVLVDGDAATATDELFKTLGVDQTGRIFFLDFGAAFPVNRLVFYPSEDNNEEFPRAYEMSVGNGRDYTASNQPRYEVLTRVDLQLDPSSEITLPVRLIRFLRLRILSPNPFEIADFEAYGEGFVPRGSYTSHLIQLPNPVNFGELKITARKLRRQPDGSLVEEPEADASVNLRFRNGTDDTPLVYNEITDRETGSEITTDEASYFKLAEDFRGSVFDDAENWTWQNPVTVDIGGMQAIELDLPGPRSYFEFQMLFEGTSTDLIEVQRLSLTYSQPLTERAIGEVALANLPQPERGIVEVPAGIDTAFTYDVRPEFANNRQTGFDALKINTQTEPTFLKLEMGNPRVEIVPDSVKIENDGLTVYFPSNRVTADNAQTVRVSFRTSIMLYTTILTCELLDTSGSLPQPVQPGDATVDVNTNSINVFFSPASSPDVITNLRARPSIFTPNNDGINDDTVIGFDVLRLVRSVDFSIGIYDLSGRMIASLSPGGLASGRFEYVWDGRDGGGQVVPPGLYLLRVSADSRADNDTFTSVLSVSY